MKSRAARYGLIAGLIAFVTAAIVPDDYTICLGFVGAVAGILPAVWGVRLVRLGGIGCSVVCFTGAAILILQAHHTDAEFVMKWQKATGQIPCACGSTHWSRVAEDSSRFTALMPAQLLRQVTTNDTEAGPVVITFLTAKPTPAIAFTIVQTMLPPNADLSDKERMFAGGLKQVLGSDGRIISERAVSLDGNPGREWCFEKRGQSIVTMRAYVVGREFYEAISILPKSDVCKRHVAEFLNSCQVRHE